MNEKRIWRKTLSKTCSYVSVKWRLSPRERLSKVWKPPFVDLLAESSNLQKELTCRERSSVGKLFSYSLWFVSYSSRRRNRRRNTEKGVDAIYTTARLRVEVGLPLYTVQPPFIVVGFLCRFLLLFRSSYFTFVLQHSYKQPTKK